MRCFVHFDPEGVVNLEAITHIKRLKSDTGIVLHLVDGKKLVLFDWTIEDILKLFEEHPP
jgi:arabinogalactan endo-1,4-beta-galactosidase